MLLRGLICYANQQMEMALELTKVVYHGKTSDSVDEQKVFATYKNALKMVAGVFAFGRLFRKNKIVQ